MLSTKQLIEHFELDVYLEVPSGSEGERYEVRLCGARSSLKKRE